MTASGPRLATTLAIAMASVPDGGGQHCLRIDDRGTHGVRHTLGRTRSPWQLATFAAPGCAGGCGSGSTVGPDGALNVTDGPGGRALRVDPRTGALKTFASGLPAAIPEVGIGGAMDVIFLGRTAYVL